MLRVGIFGYGKMGAMVQKCALEFKNLEISKIFAQGENEIFTTDFEIFFKSCDVVIDFSLANGTRELLKFAKDHPKNLVIGTTGLSENDLKEIEILSKNMAILYASNFSLGVALLNKITKECAKILADFDAEIVEIHHNKKADAPSGTALSLAKSIANGRDLNLDDVLITNRDHKRQKNEISIQALRGGDVAGIHSVNFFGNAEYIELKHSAKDRSIFANGALKCALFLANKKTGFYKIEDCLGI